jgi:hypothetical protein
MTLCTGDLPIARHPTTQQSISNSDHAESLSLESHVPWVQDRTTNPNDHVTSSCYSDQPKMGRINIISSYNSLLEKLRGKKTFTDTGVNRIILKWILGKEVANVCIILNRLKVGLKTIFCEHVGRAYSVATIQTSIGLTAGFIVTLAESSSCLSSNTARIRSPATLQLFSEDCCSARILTRQS